VATMGGGGIMWPAVFDVIAARIDGKSMPSASFITAHIHTHTHTNLYVYLHIRTHIRTQPTDMQTWDAQEFIQTTSGTRRFFDLPSGATHSTTFVTLLEQIKFANHRLVYLHIVHRPFTQYNMPSTLRRFANQTGKIMWGALGSSIY
jgi:hypothetical protein